MTKRHRELNPIGWREWIALPGLGVPAIKAKVDTGARSSALHTFETKPFRRRGEDWLHFCVHPVQRDSKIEVWSKARVLDRRVVRSSTGHEQTRWFVTTDVEIGGERWPIELALTSRDAMGFRMLLGREAVRNRYLVDPGRSYLTRKLTKSEVARAYKKSRPSESR